MKLGWNVHKGIWYLLRVWHLWKELFLSTLELILWISNVFFISYDMTSDSFTFLAKYFEDIYR